MKRQKGFTLVELLIAVVIIGILVSISIPIFTAQMHKAEVAADWANLRAYYAEIQADYMSTQQQNPKVSFTTDKGYSIAYNCNKGHAKCDLGLGEKYTSQ